MIPCTKHGYTNPTFCPICDLETIELYRVPDYSKPGTREAVKAEVDEICDNALPKE